MFTDSLLQNARKLARVDVFGEPASNAAYGTALKYELEKLGHYVHLGLLDMKAILERMYDVA